MRRGLFVGLGMAGSVVVFHVGLVLLSGPLNRLLPVAENILFFARGDHSHIRIRTNIHLRRSSLDVFVTPDLDASSGSSKMCGAP